MKYRKVYDQIIERARIRELLEYTERHHIIPKCMGGCNSKNNIVRLTYREHFICHWLLCKIYPTEMKIKAAFAKMLESTKNNNRIISSHMFDAVKRNLKDTHFPWLKNREPWNKGKVGVQVAWNKGIKTKPCSEDRRNKTSMSLKERYSKVPHHRKNIDPWNKGKTGTQVAWNKGIRREQHECPHCHKLVDPLNMKRWHNEKCKQRNEEQTI